MVSLFCMTPLPSRIPEDRGEIHKEGAARRRSRTGVGQDGAEDVSGHDVRTRAVLHEPRAGRSTEVPAFFRATYAAPMEGLRVFIIARRVWLGVGAAALAGVIVWRIVGRRQDQRLIFRPAPPVSVHERAWHRQLLCSLRCSWAACGHRRGRRQGPALYITNVTTSKLGPRPSGSTRTLL